MVVEIEPHCIWHRWDTKDNNCLPTWLSFSVQQSPRVFVFHRAARGRRTLISSSRAPSPCWPRPTSWSSPTSTRASSPASPTSTRSSSTHHCTASYEWTDGSGEGGHGERKIEWDRGLWIESGTTTVTLQIFHTPILQYPTVGETRRVVLYSTLRERSRRNQEKPEGESNQVSIITTHLLLLLKNVHLNSPHSPTHS